MRWPTITIVSWRFFYTKVFLFTPGRTRGLFMLKASKKRNSLFWLFLYVYLYCLFLRKACKFFYSFLQHSSVMLVFGHTPVAYQKTHIAAFRHSSLFHIVPYNKGNPETSAMGMQSKIIGIIHYPFIIVPVGFLNSENMNRPLNINKKDR